MEKNRNQKQNHKHSQYSSKKDQPAHRTGLKKLLGKHGVPFLSDVDGFLKQLRQVKKPQQERVFLEHEQIHAKRDKITQTEMKIWEDF